MIETTEKLPTATCGPGCEDQWVTCESDMGRICIEHGDVHECENGGYYHADCHDTDCRTPRTCFFDPDMYRD